MFRRIIRVTLLSGLVLLANGVGHAQAAWNPNSAQLDALAQRFRPYLKFSTGAREEPRPMTWQHLYENSRLKRGSITIFDLGELRGAGAARILKYANILADPDGARSYSIDIDTSHNAQYGVDWKRVEGGDGIYAHVTYLKTVTSQSPSQNLVNIEYWVLFGFNAGYVPAEDHKGDVIAVSMVYDHASDKIVRVAFSEHGRTLIIFDLARSKSPAPAMLDGKDDNGSHIKQAACKVSSQDDGYYAGGLGGGPGIFRGGEHHVFFARDPVSGRCEHLALYIERGSHEPWPNQSGYYIGVASHNGDDISFLPRSVHMLGSLDAPFVNFGGSFGDPVGLMRHKMWLGYFRGDDPKDVDPYVDHGSLKWLPTLAPTE
ncbi:MAG TPA: hypothetical protein VGC56_13880 [Allosphingosinicella sp.]|jgi:hypothetical protein